jgi:hypothetical protein
MKMKKGTFIFLGMIALVIGFGFARIVLKNDLSAPVALADDEDDESEDDDDDEDGGESKTETVVTYKTIYVKLPDTMAEKIIQVPLHDSDSDGIYDGEDQYPFVNKFFVVEDKNLNGINDEYEKFGR